jgi:hypothetical protein
MARLTLTPTKPARLAVVSAAPVTPAVDVVVSTVTGGVAAVNERQNVAVTLNSGTGTLDVTFAGVTITSAHDDDQAEVQALFDAQTDDPGDVVVTGATWADRDLEVAGNLAGVNPAPATVDLTGITGDTPDATVVVTTEQADVDAVAEVTRFTVTGVGSTGTYTATFGGQTTAGIVPGCSAADFKAAFVALSNVASSDLTVTRAGTGTVDDPWLYDITWAGAHAGNVTPPTVTLTGLALGVDLDVKGRSNGTAVRIKNNGGGDVEVTVNQNDSSPAAKLADDDASFTVAAGTTKYVGLPNASRYCDASGLLNLDYARTGDLTFEAVSA